MLHREFGYLIVGQQLFQFVVFYLAYGTATGTYCIIKLFGDMFQLVLHNGAGELMPDNEVCVQQQFDRIVHGCATHMKISIFKLLPDHFERKRLLRLTNCLIDSSSFGRIP
jgi:hypothetical protein